jgi:predicted Na+-dependent transporter
VKTLDLNWWRIALAIVVPMVLGVLVGKLFWRREDSTMGSVVAAGVIFALVLLFFAGEYIEIARFQVACLDAHITCKLRLAAHNRYFIYGFIGFIDVAIVFAMGLRHEERARIRN